MLPSIFFQICCLKSACLGSPNLRKSLSMAAFHLIIYGRFCVITEDQYRLHGSIETGRHPDQHGWQGPLV
jgi:hypothetical protein